MPRGDRTGPDGLGPMTGRRAGYCAGYSVPGYMNDVPGWGRGYGYGRGYRWGAGYGRVYYPADVPPAVDEKTFLENQLKYLEQQQENLRKRLNDLTTKKGED